MVVVQFVFILMMSLTIGGLFRISTLQLANLVLKISLKNRGSLN